MLLFRMVTWAHRCSNSIVNITYFHLRLLPTLQDGPSFPMIIPGGKMLPQVEKLPRVEKAPSFRKGSLGSKKLPRVEKAASRGSYSFNRPSNWRESQSWGICCVYLVKSQIVERGAMWRPLFSLDFPNNIEKQLENRNLASEKSTQTP